MFVCFLNRSVTDRWVQGITATFVVAAGLLVPTDVFCQQAIASSGPQLKDAASAVQHMPQKGAFQERTIDQAIIAVALPRINGRYSLNIYYQISNDRPCWSEQASIPARVEAHMLDFDFTDICGRSTDSNGYSLRINGEELGMRYRLQLTTTDSEILLQAMPELAGDPVHTIGSSHGLIPGEIMKIYLNPGWQMTQRVYEEQPLGHIYFSTNITEEPIPVSPVEVESDMVPSIGSNANE
ncbi:MAG: DUF3747 domain-containing protein [Leptolyngbyaceae bacterium]|nr:DUF3747 domain-containing protein [Leptolyngbyaceae bacterium]